MERRAFLGTVAGAGLLAGVARAQTTPGAAQRRPADPSDLPRVTDPGERRGDMLYRMLGSTGERVSLIGLGGFHIGAKILDDSESIRLQHAAIDRGITFMDNSWDYREGRSELLMGRALSQGGYRDKVFLMTKIDGRTKEEAARQLETSLKRLNTDRIDLVQHHEIIRFDDPDRIFDEGGAMEAFVEAKQAGKLRYIGFTGHKDPHVHRYMLEVAGRHGFHFDTVQMPLNVMDAHYRSFAHEVLPVLVEQKIGVLGMKSLGDSVILKSGASVSAIDCLHYAMNLPTSVVITGIDSQKILDQAFEAARTFRPMDQQQVAALLAKTAPYAAAGKYELFKSSSHFDGTAHNPEWLGGETPSVRALAPG